MRFMKSLDAGIIKVEVGDHDMQAINQQATEPLEATQVYAGRMALCNNQYDRAHERFPEGYLKRFAETIVGKSVLSGHDYRSLPVGRFYAAELQKTGGDRIDLVTRYYMLADDELVPKIRAGVVKGVSVGFQPDRRLCDLCGKDYDDWFFMPSDGEEDESCRHIAGRMYGEAGAKRRCTLTY